MPLRNYRCSVLNIRSRHSHSNVSDMGFWTRSSSWVMQYTVHWPGEYPPTPPSPHSLNTSQESRYGNWTVCSCVGESGGKNNFFLNFILQFTITSTMWVVIILFVCRHCGTVICIPVLCEWLLYCSIFVTVVQFYVAQCYVSGYYIFHISSL